MADIFKTNQDAAPGTTIASAVKGGGGVVPIKDMVLKYITEGYKYVDLEMVNYFLVACIAVLLLYLGISLSGDWRRLKMLDTRKLAVEQAGKQDKPAKDIVPLRGAQYYQDKINRRDIFVRASQSRETAHPAFSTQMEQYTASLKLVGISWSSDPDAMIEDSRQGKTYFVKKGSKVGELVVENILKEKVVLRYNKESFDLK
jgi:hypothetical protein